MQALDEIAFVKTQVKKLLSIAGNDLVPELAGLDQQLSTLENTPKGSSVPGLRKMENDFSTLFNVLQDSDNTPTSQAIKAANKLKQDFLRLEDAWRMIKDKTIPELNRKLTGHSLSPVKIKW